MKLNMTEPTKNYYINVLADDAAVILNDIKNTPEQTTAELWKEKFKEFLRPIPCPAVWR